MNSQNWTPGITDDFGFDFFQAYSANPFRLLQLCDQAYGSAGAHCFALPPVGYVTQADMYAPIQCEV